MSGLAMATPKAQTSGRGKTLRKATGVAPVRELPAASHASWVEEVTRHLVEQLSDRVALVHDPVMGFGRAEDVAAMLMDGLPQSNAWAEVVGPVYTGAALARKLRISRQAVTQRSKTKSLWGLKTSDGHLVFPAIQFEAGMQVIPELPRVLKIFSASPVDDWMVASWLLAEQPALAGQSAIAWLRHHQPVEDVLKLAQATTHRWGK